MTKKYDINNLKFRNLKKEELNVKVSNCNAYGSMFLLYKDARCDADILDETVGNGNWCRDHKAVKTTMFGGIGIWDVDKTQWVWKWDAGVPSFAESEKGEASDSYKRAGFVWGIGRKSLYNSPDIKISNKIIPVKDKGGNKYTLAKQATMRVSFIEYDTEGIIEKIIIEWKNPDNYYNWEECFKYPGKVTTPKPTTTKKIEPKAAPSNPNVVKEPTKEALSMISNDRGIQKLLTTEPKPDYDPAGDFDFKTIRWITKDEVKYLMGLDVITDIKTAMDYFYGTDGLGIGKASGEDLQNKLTALKNKNDEAEAQATKDIVNTEVLDQPRDATAEEIAEAFKDQENNESSDDLPF